MPNDPNKGGVPGAHRDWAAEVIAADEHLKAMTARAEAAEAEIAALKAQSQADAQKAVLANAAEVDALCHAAGVSAMAAALIREGVAAKDAQARIDSAKDIRAAVEIARKRCPEIEAAQADRYIAAGTRLETVRADLFARIAAAEEAGEIAARVPGDGVPRGKQDVPPDAWDKAIAKANARFDSARAA